MSKRYIPQKNGVLWKVDEQGKICNRALYCTQSNTSVLAGDLPLVRLVQRTRLWGTLQMSVLTPTGPLPLESLKDLLFSYRPGWVTWTLSDARLPGKLTIEVGVPENKEGFCLHISAQKPCTLGWSWSQMITFPAQAGAGEDGWNLTTVTNPELAEVMLPVPGLPLSAVGCETGLALRCAAADRGFDRTLYLQLPENRWSAGENSVEGEFSVENECFFSALLDEVPDDTAFSAAVKNADRLASFLEHRSPDKALDSLLACVGAEIEAAWHPPVVYHATSVYSMPFIGWCNRYGHACMGWFEHCREELQHYVQYQITQSTATGFSRDEQHLACQMAPDSRFYGKGRIAKDQGFYNMQTQFFDQMIFAWRLSGDEEMARLLYPALKLHTQWQDECFDPDQDGLYESYINTWPTDSVWYNGGGSCEETCYAYRAHEAAAELARHFGDPVQAEHHRRISLRIKQAFFQKLWIRDLGIPAKMIEKGFYGRAHRDPWLYNCFLPVDVDLTRGFDSVTALWYSKWALENVVTPGNGRSVWMSNWVPAVWSVRKNAVGENLQLAYAFFKAGFAQEGYALLKGAVSFYFENDAPLRGGSEDTSLLVRAVLQGLHGYEPDAPNQSLVLSPHYPAAWKKAFVKNRYFEASYQKSKNQLSYRFKLERPAKTELRLCLPLCRDVQVTGAENWRMEPGYACQILCCTLGCVQEGALEVRFTALKPVPAETRIRKASGTSYTLNPEPIIALHDPQQVLSSWSIQGQQLRFTTKDVGGTHLLFAECEDSGCRYWRILRLELGKSGQQKEQERRSRLPAAGSGLYESIDTTGLYNAQLQQIFQQTYQTSFTDCCCLTLGKDGYSPWTFPWWNTTPPVISVNKPQGDFVFGPEGIPFYWPQNTCNIGFTTLWDNYPSELNLPVGKKGKRIHFLVAGSTNPMQCHIANAVLELHYADNVTESLELINPVNFWSLCGYKGEGMVIDQAGADDYSYETDGFCLPKIPPKTLQLGENCRGCQLDYRLRKAVLESVTLRCLSQEVVIGLIAVTLEP